VDAHESLRDSLADFSLFRATRVVRPLFVSLCIGRRPDGDDPTPAPEGGGEGEGDLN
jgi:hypothetical protein